MPPYKKHQPLVAWSSNPLILRLIKDTNFKDYSAYFLNF
jgi:hypothetical protein